MWLVALLVKVGRHHVLAHVHQCLDVVLDKSRQRQAGRTQASTYWVAEQLKDPGPNTSVDKQAIQGQEQRLK